MLCHHAWRLICIGIIDANVLWYPIPIPFQVETEHFAAGEDSTQTPSSPTSHDVHAPNEPMSDPDTLQAGPPKTELSTPTTPRKRGRPRKDSVSGPEDKEEEPDLDELHETLGKLLFVLSSEDEEGYFSRPVNVEADPRYLELVKKPMDFGSMEKKLAERTYRALCEFQVSLVRTCFTLELVRETDVLAG